MRRVMLLGIGLLALTTAGLAVAAGLHGNAHGVRAVAGTFTATSASGTTKTCTTDDGKSVAVTAARYAGTAGGDPDLAGPIRIDARSVINTTDDVGRVTGRLRIDVASGGDTSASFDAVYDHGRLAGFAAGRAHEPHAALLANLSAGFSAASGFTDGKLGGGTAGGSALEVGPAKCRPSKTPKEKTEARGSVTALSSSSITVAGLTCAIPAHLAQKASSLKVGDRAAIRCAFANGQNTLTKLEKKR